jgi:hypothetical protein
VRGHRNQVVDVQPIQTERIVWHNGVEAYNMFSPDQVPRLIDGI